MNSAFGFGEVSIKVSSLMCSERYTIMFWLTRLITQWDLADASSLSPSSFPYHTNPTII